MKLAAKHATVDDIRALELALALALARQQDLAIIDEAFCQADVAFHRALVDASGNGMLRFVMYTVIEALVPVTNMVVTVVRERSAILALHEQMLLHLKRKKSQPLIATMDQLLDYLLQQFELASQR